MRPLLTARSTRTPTAGATRASSTILRVALNGLNARPPRRATATQNPAATARPPSLARPRIAATARPTTNGAMPPCTAGWLRSESIDLPVARLSSRSEALQQPRAAAYFDPERRRIIAPAAARDPAWAEDEGCAW